MRIMSAYGCTGLCLLWMIDQQSRAYHARRRCRLSSSKSPAPTGGERRGGERGMEGSLGADDWRAGEFHNVGCWLPVPS